MTLLDRIKETLWRTGQTEALFRYHCRECGAEFETAESSRSKVECPECHATGTRSLSNL